MKGKNEVSTIIISTLLFTFLFYKKSLGLNLVLFECLFFIFLVATRQIQFKTNIQILGILGVCLTSIFTIITYSTFIYVIHFIVLFIFIGGLNFPKSKSLISVLRTSLFSLLQSQNKFISKIFNSNSKRKKLFLSIWNSRIFVIPALIVFIFILIYSASNSEFNELVTKGVTFLQIGINFILKDIEFLIIITFFIGIIISNFLFIRITSNAIETWDEASSNTLIRSKRGKRKPFGILALKNEYKAATFLLFTLNIILLLVNVLDIYWVWFNFNWTGQLLKKFVHEGTYLLIFSILISIAIILFFFRRSLNFYKENKLLKILGYAWLIQNAVLTISVGIRNFWYINHYALAYKRIGVIIFLLLVLYGLYTVFVKIKDKKTTHYLWSSNAIAIYIVLVISSLINWDNIIATYNFKHSEKSYVHLEYLSSLSNKAIPLLEKSVSELHQIEKNQKEIFSVSKHEMTPKGYYKIIENRKQSFKNNWESKSFIEWNFTEYLAYSKLFINDRD